MCREASRDEGRSCRRLVECYSWRRGARHRLLLAVVPPLSPYDRTQWIELHLYLGFSSKVSMLQFLILKPETWRLHFASPSPYDFSINLPQLFCMCRLIAIVSHENIFMMKTNICHRCTCLSNKISYVLTKTKEDDMHTPQRKIILVVEKIGEQRIHQNDTVRIKPIR